MKKKSLLITTIAIFGFAIISMAQTVPSYVPTSGLVGWWPFTGNANDSSGNGNNGTVTGATLTSDRFGNANCAYSFNGVADYIFSNRVFYPAFTVSVWLNSDTLQSIAPIVDAFDANWELMLTNNIPTYISFSSPSSYTGLFSAGSTLNNNWYNLICTYSIDTVSLYLNGVRTDVFSVDPLVSIGGIYNFGASLTGVDQFFKGKLDDIGIWNRALDSCEIKDLYFARTGSCCHISVSTQPVSQSATISNTSKFTIASSDSSSTYQWQSDLGIGFQNINSVGQYSGTTNDTLSVSSVTMGNNNQPFRCIVSSGACSDTSSAAVLTVINANGINETATNNLFTVYPNPAKSQINVKVDATLIGASYAIYDNIGKVTLSGKINAENTVIELGSLSGGIYLFSIGDNLKQMFTVVKE